MTGRVRADGLPVEAALSTARRAVDVVFGGRLSLAAPDDDGRTATSPPMHGGQSAFEVLEAQLRGHGFGVLRHGGPDGWYLVVDLMDCPSGASQAHREALAIRCARIEEIIAGRYAGTDAPSAGQLEAAKSEHAHCMTMTVTALHERVAAAQWVLDNHYGDGSEQGRSDRRAMTEALVDHAASITRKVAAQRGHRNSAEIEGLARMSAREERRMCECLRLDRLRERAARRGLPALEAPELRAAGILFLLAASRGLEEAALKLVGEEGLAAGAEMLRQAAAARATYAALFGLPPAEARWLARPAG